MYGVQTIDNASIALTQMRSQVRVLFRPDSPLMVILWSIFEGLINFDSLGLIRGQHDSVQYIQSRGQAGILIRYRLHIEVP